MTKNPTQWHSGLALVGFILVTFCAPLFGVTSMPGEWYAALSKPWWNPPAWLFGPAWTVLYTLMAVAVWLIWRRVGFTRALGLYFVQLILNAAWTPIFFGAHAMGWAFIEIVIMWIAILLTLLSFLQVQKAAGLLLVPYLAWVTFATFLNYTLWRLNPS